ncbi:MAG: hypothetical protein WCA22_17060 [Candidatus Binatus sp.]
MAAEVQFNIWDPEFRANPHPYYGPPPEQVYEGRFKGSRNMLGSDPPQKPAYKGSCFLRGLESLPVAID